MEKGKLDANLLSKLVLGKTGAKRDEVLVGAGLGEDCATLDFGEFDCIVSTDPITAEAKNPGALAVYVACNDIASNGVKPLAILLTLLFPETTSEEEIAAVAEQADAAAREIGVQIAGGHTEITDAVTRPLISAAALGRTPKRVQNEAPKAGDKIFVTKKLGLEGTYILAERKKGELSGVLTDEELSHAREGLKSISVITEGVLGGEIGVSAMHDITEGGILGALWEICELYSVGARIDEAALPFDEITLKACSLLELDPARLISSGSLLIICPAEKAAALTEAIADADIEITEIGEITERENGALLVRANGTVESIAPPTPDEIYKL